MVTRSTQMARAALRSVLGKVSTRPQGYRIYSGPAAGMTLALSAMERPSMVLGTYERRVVRAMRRYARPGMVAYDVGAHIGYLTLVLARLVGPAGRVVAFEADPRNGDALRRIVALNRLATVSVVPGAVSDRVGFVRFASFGYTTVGHIATKETPDDARLIDVASTTLDAVVAGGLHPPPQFIKIDVEGAEAAVLRGAMGVIEAHRPVVVVEARDTPAWRTVATTMAAMGYRAKTLTDWGGGMADIVLVPPQLGRLSTRYGKHPALS